ncbi:MAG: T9SS type A sorting domain-containing protein, partial [Bacteroidales bacterium]|nr:T9SS type A sorting domain-containing protein [Bacteroidales bacterium]
MNKNILLIIMLLTLLFCRVNKLFSQEWEYSLEYGPYDNEMLFFCEPTELSDGNIAVASYYSYKRANTPYIYSKDPAVVILSSNGEELARCVFHREGYTSMTYTPYLIEKDGDLFALFTHSPEHDYDSPNYFLNYDNPPEDAILSFCKLDEELNIIDSCEYRFPIDIFQDSKWWQWQEEPNEFSGHLFMLSVFEDKEDLIGSYIKTVSADIDSIGSRGHDSLFFFRMNFEGEIVDMKGYERETHGFAYPSIRYRRNQILKTDSNYLLYEAYNKDIEHGRVLYYDQEFNHVATKYIVHPDYNYPILDADPLKDISVLKINDSTTYLSVTASCIDNPHNDSYNDVRLYKLNDNIENASDYLSTENYIIRGGPYTYERPPGTNSVDVANDTSIYFACNYNMHDLALEPYCVIECLNADMDTIFTFYYEKYLESIRTIDDGNILLTGYNHIAKIHVSAFTNIEEAHAHNLHLAVAYPNPGGDVMNIRTSLRDCTLQVYDMQGRLVHQQEITDDVTSVDTSSWSSGTYVWELGTENGSGILE